MSDRTCPHCGRPLEPTLTRCPHCDWQAPRRDVLGGLLIAGLVIGLLLALIGIPFFAGGSDNRDANAVGICLGLTIEAIALLLLSGCGIAAVVRKSVKKQG